jgi:hypothetical protein
MEVKEPTTKEQSEISYNSPETIPQPTSELTNMSNVFDDVKFLSPTDTIPTGFPRNPFNRIVLYVNGGTKRLYIYNVEANIWYYSTLT